MSERQYSEPLMSTFRGTQALMQLLSKTTFQKIAQLCRNPRIYSDKPFHPSH